MAATIGKSKADTSFRAKAQQATRNREWAKVEEIYLQYGTYLELIEPEQVKA